MEGVRVVAEAVRRLYRDIIIMAGCDNLHAAEALAHMKWKKKPAVLVEGGG